MGKSHLEACSLWYAPDDPTITLDVSGRVYHDDDSVKVKCRGETLTDHPDLPDDPLALQGWCITVTTASGEHFHGAIDSVEDRPTQWVCFHWETGPLATYP